MYTLGPKPKVRKSLVSANANLKKKSEKLIPKAFSVEYWFLFFMYSTPQICSNKTNLHHVCEQAQTDGGP